MGENTNSKDLLKILQSLENDKLNAIEKIHVAVITNVNLRPIFDIYLKHFLLQSKIDAEISFLDFDDFFVRIYSQQSKLFHHEYDYILVLPNNYTFNDHLFRIPYQLEDKKLVNEIELVKQNLQLFLQTIRNESDAIILWHLFEMPVNPIVLTNSNINNAPYHIIKDLNYFIEYELTKRNNSFVIDTNTLFHRFGSDFMYDKRQWHLSQLPYSKGGCRELTRYIASYIRIFIGKAKKCLVLDCDDLLWGGIVGEEGISNVHLSPFYPGSFYYEFQQEVLNFYNRGILIALCSKNNEPDVIDMLQNHPHMLIKEYHLAAHEINWDDKASNITKIAKKLNISLDSIIFMDDTELEIHQVRKLLPEVRAIHMPREKPHLFKDKLLEEYDLSNHSLTTEDINRTKMYQEEEKRQNDRSLKSKESVEDYLKSLEMKVEISMASEMNISRVAQLTQKTNQFNLTTIRCTEDDVKALCNNEHYDVIVIKLEDRFGNLGVIGTSFIRYGDDTAEIEQFILSCRALGRSIEKILLAYIIKRVKSKGLKQIIGKYRVSPKNQQTSLFYQKNGFQKIDIEGNYTNFHCELSNYANLEQWRNWIECRSLI
ncbi:HAD-IIIC family phosphatase [Virgibacillus sp. NKC19-3]|uniref:HAD-IIIC family phosphatase n=1 Tax=Virgibacillus saliphilus TaxID=2831674 RepID=UPI001C9B70E5|nr:HAD-IIIC family phosphatase [Virgibacillus sp. NKC19-3]MBY7142468.1 HAD-IIIC family phosphatase [Virgibacillus sp. NKC19-3]